MVTKMKQLKLTRRQFIQSTAGAIALPYVITTSALAGETKSPASERVTLGHIGVGGRADGGRGSGDGPAYLR